MKFIASYLAVLFFAGLVLSCMTQMTNDTHETNAAHALSRLLAGVFVFNLLATVAFWLDIQRPVVTTIFIAGHVAFAAYAFFRLRAVGKDLPAEDGAPHSA
jgi:glucan phosphoethanolaminetransferase (alkaline phosphatase superfamily)